MSRIQMLVPVLVQLYRYMKYCTVPYSGMVLVHWYSLHVLLLLLLLLSS
eukprot:COSAG01_NODE_40528_length_462_cov_2.636364_1_plen_49_part_00